MGLSREQAMELIKGGYLDILLTDDWKHDDQLQVYAVKLDPKNIKYITNPCLGVKQMVKEMKKE